MLGGSGAYFNVDSEFSKMSASSISAIAIYRQHPIVGCCSFFRAYTKCLCYLPSAWGMKRGNSVRNKMAKYTYTVGDIHGCYKTFRELVEGKIGLSKADELIVLGDMINRGPRSEKVLAYLMELIEAGYAVTCLKGNHELKLLMAYGSGEEFLELFLTKYRSLDLLTDDLERYLRFISKMEVYVEREGFLLSHVGFNDIVKTPSTDTRSLFSLSATAVDLKGMRQLTGHYAKPLRQIMQEVHAQQKVISLDGGCVHVGRDELGYLCCLELKRRTVNLSEEYGGMMLPCLRLMGFPQGLDLKALPTTSVERA